jgi:hypothetical protein
MLLRLLNRLRGALAGPVLMYRPGGNAGNRDEQDRQDSRIDGMKLSARGHLAESSF